jgi:uncharacterized protein YkwD
VCSGNTGGIGENLAASGSAPVPLDNANVELVANQLMTAWMNSPGHRQQLLWPDHTRMGVGVGIKMSEDGARAGVAIATLFYRGSCPEIAS